MPSLAVDACALLHAKQLPSSDESALAVLDALLEQGVSLLHTSVIEQQCRTMTLAAFLDDWDGAGRFHHTNAKLTERRQVKNALHRSDKIPGDSDIDLIAVARRCGCPLLTHDEAAAVAARRNGVYTFDLVDLGHVLVLKGWRTWEWVDQRLAGFDSYSWRPDDWDATASKTALSRPAPDRFERRVSDWLVRP